MPFALMILEKMTLKTNANETNARGKFSTRTNANIKNPNRTNARGTNAYRANSRGTNANRRNSNITNAIKQIPNDKCQNNAIGQMPKSMLLDKCLVTQSLNNLHLK
jgi:hypothetical protein